MGVAFCPHCKDVVAVAPNGESCIRCGEHIPGHPSAKLPSVPVPVVVYAPQDGAVASGGRIPLKADDGSTVGHCDVTLGPDGHWHGRATFTARGAALLRRQGVLDKDGLVCGDFVFDVEDDGK